MIARFRLILQRQFVMFGALSLVVASFGAGLVVQAPEGPVIGVGVGVAGVGAGGPESPDFVAGQGD
jgi:hypothetical protein